MTTVESSSVSPSESWQSLATAYLPFARWLARDRAMSGFARLEDEMVGAAEVALVLAARSFDPSRGVSFPCWAAIRVRGACQDVIRQEILRGYRTAVARRRASSPPEVMSLVPEMDEPMGRVLCAEPDDPIGWEVDAIDAAEWWLGWLPDRHRTVCQMVFLQGQTNVEIGRRLGLSSTTVARLRTEAKAILAGSWAARRYREGA